MVSVIEQEMRIGAMIRTMSGDVRDTFRDQIYDLYADENGKVEGYRESCARWHWILLVYCDNPDAIKEYIDMIQMYYFEGKDPDKDENWRLLMRRVLPYQFILKINTRFTQVPRLAIMDQTPLRYKQDQKNRVPMFSDIKW